MTETSSSYDERTLTIEEIINDALMFLDYPIVINSPDGATSPDCDLSEEDFELARASIAYMGYRLLLMYYMKGFSAENSACSWAEKSRRSDEIRQEIASALGISGATFSREEEVKRLYLIASKTIREDKAYCKKIDGFMEGFVEDYDLDPNSLGLIIV